MEQQHSNKQYTILLDHLSLSNINLIISFLDTHTLSQLCESTPTNIIHQSVFLSHANVKLFINRYLTRTDRSIYMPFYSDQQFLKLEQQQIFHICQQSPILINCLNQSFSQLFGNLVKEMNSFELAQDMVNSIKDSLTDPELPFPKLRKQNIGMHCNSGFQFFLVDKLFPLDDEECLEETFEELKNYLSDGLNNQVILTSEQLDLIHFTYSSWFKISYQNYQEYLIPQLTLHNLVVEIIALLDLIIDSFHFYIQTITDPLHNFIEFNMRYCIFRNVVLSLEEKIGFIFDYYNQLCSTLFMQNDYFMKDQDDVRQIRVWHCALSKWYIYMQCHHDEYFPVFFYMFKKVNLTNIKSENQASLSQATPLIELQNRLDLHQIDILSKQSVFDVHSDIEDYLDENQELYKQIIKEYIQYIVDISINEYSVHWCGHSQQIMHIPYQQFQQKLIAQFSLYITKMIKIVEDIKNPVQITAHIVKTIIEEIDKELLHAVTFKKILQLIQEKLISISNTFAHQQMLKGLFQKIDKSLQVQDSVLEHFNEQSNISNEISYKYSIVLQTEDFNKQLKNSASTNASHQYGKLRSCESIIEMDMFD